MNDELDRRLIAQLHRCYERIPFYRRRWPRDVLSYRSADDLRRLPFVTKDDLLDDLEEIYASRVASPGSKVSALHLTSGTSGLGQEIHPLTTFDAEGLSASWVRRLTMAGLEPGDSIAFTFPVGLQAGGLVGFRIAERMGLVSYFLGAYPTDRKVDYLLKFSPHALVITPSYLTRITTLLRDLGHRSSPFPLRGLFISGESHTLAWAEEMSDWWNTKLYEWYSCMQAGTAVAYSCERGVVDEGQRGHLHIDERRTLVEILSPDTLEPVGPAEEGEVVITSVFREAFPVIRFRTGDKVRLHEGACACGRTGRSLIAGTASRYDDMIKIRGQNVWPTAVDDIILGRPEVEEYQARVFLGDRHDERVEIALEWKPGLDVSTEDAARAVSEMEDEIRRRVNVAMALKAVPPLSLPRYEFKVRRWTDERKEQPSNVARYTERTS